MRTTRRDMYRAVEGLADACGTSMAQDYKDVGAWELDYNAIYGGAVIQEVVNSAGGVTLPLGQRRMAPGAFVEACELATKAIRYSKVKRDN